MEDTLFNQFLLNNREKYQGITFDKFTEFFEISKKQARVLTEVLGLDAQALDEDTPRKHLDRMLADGKVFEIGGLFWTDDAVSDAKADYSVSGGTDE